MARSVAAIAVDFASLAITREETEFSTSNYDNKSHAGTELTTISSDADDVSRVYTTLHFTLHFTVYYYTLNNIHYTIYYTLHYTLYNLLIQYTELHSKLCYTVHFTLYTIHYSLYTIHNLLLLQKHELIVCVSFVVAHLVPLALSHMWFDFLSISLSLSASLSPSLFSCCASCSTARAMLTK